ncbi:MAG: sterol desaturase family protein, partial [Ottowia sp.]|nr:sterol desaturase family protein [Ottowia sp.]
WIPATWIPRLGPLEWVLNTPSAHRLHHAANLEYLDGNYGGVLIVFDRLFGTYIPERADLKPRYGLVKPLTGYNLLTVEFGQWRDLWRDLRGARSVGEALGYLWRPPGWRPGGGETTEELRQRAALAAEPMAEPAGTAAQIAPTA